MFIEIFLKAIFEMALIPLVISKNPVKSGLINEELIFSLSNKGVSIVVKIFNIPLDFKIEIILANITIKPPISSIVEILDVILWAKTSPKFEKETFRFEFVFSIDDV